MPEDAEKLEVLVDLSKTLKRQDSETALNLGEQAVVLAGKLNDSTMLAMAHMNIAGAQNVMANFEMAMTSTLKAIEILEGMDSLTLQAKCFRQLGNIYIQLDNQDKALEYFNKSTELYKEDGNLAGVASNLGNIGNLYMSSGDIDHALENFFMALKQFQDLGNEPGVALCYGVIGNAYRKQEDYDQSLKYYMKALEYFEAKGDIYNQSISILNIGVNYKRIGDYNKAEEYFQRSLELSKELGAKVSIRKAYINLAAVHYAKEEYKQAYDYYEQYSIVKDSIFTEESAKLQAEMAEKYESAEKEKELVKAQAEKDKADQLNIFFTVAFVLFIGLVILILRNLRQKKKANALLEAQKSEIEEKNENLTSANQEITMQKQEIEEKNKDILDSITYAKRLQDAILPPAKLTREYLRQSFIVYKPKDIVSGDFYWTESEDGLVLFSAVDCTGHGVPGAMVSVVGHNGLTRTVREFGLREPAKILDKLNFLVEETFGRDTDASAIRDGMDLALCSLDWDTRKLQYAGANNPLYIIRKEGTTINGAEPNLTYEGYDLFEFKADKQPIGAYDGRKPFTNHEFDMQPGDTIYIFSDGYADQFGGDKGKKFKYRNFKLLLASIQEKDMDQQRDILQKTIDDWMADYEQVDDICVIGVRV